MLRVSSSRRPTRDGILRWLPGKRGLVAIAAVGLAGSMLPVASATAWDSVPPIASHNAITSHAIDALVADPSEPADFRAWLTANKTRLVDYSGSLPGLWPFGELVHRVKRPLTPADTSACSSAFSADEEPTGSARWAVGNNPGDTHPEYWWQTAVCLYRSGDTDDATRVLGQLIHQVEDQGAVPHAFYKMHGAIGADQYFEYLAATSEYDTSYYQHPTSVLFTGKNVLDVDSGCGITCIGAHGNGDYATFPISESRSTFVPVELAPNSGTDPLPTVLQTPAATHVRLDFGFQLNDPSDALGSADVRVAVLYERADGTTNYLERTMGLDGYTWSSWDLYDDFAANGRLWISTYRTDNGSAGHVGTVRVFVVDTHSALADVAKPSLRHPWEYYDFLREWTQWNNDAPYWRRYFAGLNVDGDLEYSMLDTPNAEMSMLTLQWHASQIVTQWLLEDAYRLFHDPAYTAADAGGTGYRVAFYDDARYNSDPDAGTPEKVIGYALGCEPYGGGACGSLVAQGWNNAHAMIGDGLFTVAGSGSHVTMKANDLGSLLGGRISSMEVRNATVYLYAGKNQTGEVRVVSSDKADLATLGFNDLAQSARIVPAGVTTFPTAADDDWEAHDGATELIPVAQNDDPGTTGPVALTIHTPPRHGTVSVSGSTIAYTPQNDFTMPWSDAVVRDSFSYDITNALGYADTATVRVAVVKQALSAGTDHTCALLAAGTLSCWGFNASGEVGDGTTDTRRVATWISGAPGAAAVAAGNDYSCAIVAGGAVTCWGANESGQLGDGTTVGHADPASVPWLSGATAIAAGWDHTCVLLAAGGVKCWGDNSLGELGDGTTTNRPSPVTVSGISTAVAIAVGWGQSCALLRDRTVTCWGDNNYGTLGDGTGVQHAHPTAVSGIDTAIAIATGGWHTCALLASGTVRCWGWNAYGQLGDGTGEDHQLAPVTVGGITSATAISAGLYDTCAVIAGGTATCWGLNDSGQLGDGTTTNRATPTSVAGLTGVQALANGQDHTCALRVVGSVACWGTNGNGELGTGSDIDHSWTPVEASFGVPHAPTGVAATAGNAAALVSWTPPASDGGSPITGYTVLSSGGQTCSTFGLLSCVVKGLTNGVAYTFTVRAGNMWGVGARSAASAPVTPEARPGPPTDVMAVAGTLRATVTWVPPDSTGGSPITHYTVTSSGGQECGATGTLSCVVTGLVNGTAYTFTVVAVTEAGHSVASWPSTPITPTPTTVVCTPGSAGSTVAVGAGATVACSVTPGSGATFTGWTATGLTPGDSGASSQVFSAASPGSTGSITAAWTDDVGVHATTFAYAIGGGAGVPGAPRDVAALPANAAATVSWTAPASGGASPITGYSVTSAPGGRTCSTTGALSCQVGGLTNGTPYSFTVTATNDEGTGPASDPSGQVTPRATVATCAPGLVNADTAIATGSTVSCSITLGPGAHLIGWTATGLAPGTSASLSPSFTAGPAGSGSIVGAWGDNLGGYTMAFGYTIAGGAVVPGAPSGVTATAGSATAVVSWTAPASDGGSPITGYLVTSSPAGHTCTPVLPTGTSCPVAGLVNGTAYTFSVSAVNVAGPGPASEPSPAVAPTTGSLAVAIAKTSIGAAAGSSIPVSLTWSTGLDAAGVAAYRLWYQVNGAGSWSQVTLSNPHVRSTTVAAKPGARYVYRVQAVTSGGAIGAPIASRAFTPTARQDSSTAVKWKGTGWTRSSSGSPFGGTLRYATRSSRSVSTTFSGTGVAWVTMLGKGMGKAEVWIDGKRVGSAISLYRTKTVARSIVFVRALAAGTHTITVKVLGTHASGATGTRVSLDAFLVVGS